MGRDNWVENRARREIEIQSRVAEFFENLFAACEDVVASFTRFYQHTARTARIDRLGANTFVVRIGDGGAAGFPAAVAARSEAAVHFVLDPAACVVKVSIRPPADAAATDRVYPISVRNGEMVVCYKDGQYSAAEFSRLVLESLLFPAGPAILACDSDAKLK